MSTAHSRKARSRALRILIAGAHILCCVALAGCAGGRPGGPAPFTRAVGTADTLTVEARHERDGYVLEVVHFDSPVEGTVPAYLYRPTRGAEDAKAPAILMQHGLPGDRSSMRRLASAYARAGVYVLSLSAPFNRADQLAYRSPRLLPAPLFDLHDSAEVVQLVREQRRAIDLLRAVPGIDAERIAYVGFSYGGWIGALLGSVEPRLRAIVLMAPTGGFASWMRSQEIDGRHFVFRAFDRLTPEASARWLRSMEPLEAERWVGRARTAPLLIQAGRNDRAVRPREIQRLLIAAAPPKQVAWYEGGHELTPDAFADQASFLEHHLSWPMEHFEAPDTLF